MVSRCQHTSKGVQNLLYKESYAQDFRNEKVEGGKKMIEVMNKANQMREKARFDAEI